MLKPGIKYLVKEYKDDKRYSYELLRNSKTTVCVQDGRGVLATFHGISLLLKYPTNTELEFTYYPTKHPQQQILAMLNSEDIETRSYVKALLEQEIEDERTTKNV